MIRSLGFVLHGIERFSAGRNEMIRVYIDSEQGVNLDDCGTVHAPVARALSGHGVNVNLEVSSPGVDRILFTPAQLVAAVGSKVSILSKSKLDGRCRFTGELLSVAEDADAVVLVEGEQYAIPVSDIERAKVLLSENI
ncbi:MAG: ribosome maturation factor RimP [Candidatus Porifericomitaceae bacterium WSBS_2022_MAG_OTU9]